MKSCIEIEDWGAGMRLLARGAFEKSLAKNVCPRPWVAKKTESGQLEFVRGVTDYTNANRTATKGVIVRFFCDIGDTYIACFPQKNGGKKIIEIEVTADGYQEKISRD